MLQSGASTFAPNKLRPPLVRQFVGARVTKSIGPGACTERRGFFSFPGPGDQVLLHQPAEPGLFQPSFRPPNHLAGSLGTVPCPRSRVSPCGLRCSPGRRSHSLDPGPIDLRGSWGLLVWWRRMSLVGNDPDCRADSNGTVNRCALDYSTTAQQATMVLLHLGSVKTSKRSGSQVGRRINPPTLNRRPLRWTHDRKLGKPASDALWGTRPTFPRLSGKPERRTFPLLRRDTVPPLLAMGRRKASKARNLPRERPLRRWTSDGLAIYGSYEHFEAVVLEHDGKTQVLSLIRRKTSEEIGVVKWDRNLRGYRFSQTGETGNPRRFREDLKSLLKMLLLERLAEAALRADACPEERGSQLLRKHCARKGTRYLLRSKRR